MSKPLMMTSLMVVSFLVSAQAKAQTALQQLKAQAGEAAVAASAQVAAPRHAVVAMAQPLTIPMRGKDVFAQCQVFEAKAFSEVRWTLPQAVQVTQFCLNKSYNRTPGYAVAASASETGITITVSGEILTGDPVLLDLGYSLRKRDGKLLGFGAALESRAAVLK